MGTMGIFPGEFSLTYKYNFKINDLRRPKPWDRDKNTQSQSVYLHCVVLFCIYTNVISNHYCHS